MTEPADARAPSCGDLAGLLAEPARLAAFAALALGAGTVDEAAEAARLTRADATRALHRLVDGGLVTREGGRHAPVAEVFRTAVRAEARLGGASGDGAGAYFRRGRLTAVPGEAGVRSKVLA